MSVCENPTKRVTLLNTFILFYFLGGGCNLDCGAVVLLTHWDHGTFLKMHTIQGGDLFLTYLFIFGASEQVCFLDLLPTVSITVQKVYTKWSTEGNCECFYK